jgi:hypothetical protein
MTTEPDPVTSALARELYWAQDRVSRARLSTPEVRDRLHDFAAQMRADERVQVPQGEGYLADPLSWRRKLKYGVFRLVRPISRRYDRLIGDHAEMTTALAERLMAAEVELSRLRREAGLVDPSEMSGSTHGGGGDPEGSSS